MLKTITLNSQAADEWELPPHIVVPLNSKKTNAVLVIPVWNEGERIILQLERLASLPIVLDVILADGSSEDGSMERARLTRLKVTTLLQTEQRGLGTALRMGLAHALKEGYTAIITVDGNGKDGLEALPRFVQELENGTDFAQGSRFLPGGQHLHTPLLRHLGIRLLIAPIISFSARFWFTDPTNGFKGISRQFLLGPRLAPFRNVFATFNFQFYLNRWPRRLGYRVTEIPVSRNYPARGKTPTKIVGLRPHLKLLRDLLSVCLGLLDRPPPRV